MPLRTLLTGPPARVLWFCALGWAFDFFDLILFAFVKLDVQRDLELTVEQLAWADGLVLLASAIGGFAFGRFADRYGRRRALSISIVVYSCGACATGLVDGFGSLCVARLVTGLGVGGEWGVGHAAVAEAYPAPLRARAAGLLQAATPAGMGLAAIGGCFVAPHVGWRACYLAAAAPALLVVIARWAMPSDDGVHESPRVPLIALFDRTHARASTVLLGLLALHMTGFWCCFAWLPAALLRDGGHSLAFVGMFHGSLAIVHVFADVLFGFLADRFGRRATFVTFCIAFAIGLAVTALGFEHLADDHVVFGVALAFVGVGAGTWSLFGVLFAEHFVPALRATAASGFYNLSRGVQLGTLPAMAALFAWSGTFAVALWVGVATALGSALLIAALPRPRVSDT